MTRTLLKESRGIDPGTLALRTTSSPGEPVTFTTRACAGGPSAPDAQQAIPPENVATDGRQRLLLVCPLHAPDLPRANGETDPPTPVGSLREREDTLPVVLPAHHRPAPLASGL